ncbi:transposase, partial [Nonomuraea sp. NPDC050680]|uniref:transposase n=1 Tax=Nonomuraea sp. NPDC050680 TaxID=3154630 RepID=UPI0033BFEDE5
MSERKPYSSDLSDGQWALIEPIITAWKAAHRSVSGHQSKYEMREIVNALLYQGRSSTCGSPVRPCCPSPTNPEPSRPYRLP